MNKETEVMSSGEEIEVGMEMKGGGIVLRSGREINEYNSSTEEIERENGMSQDRDECAQKTLDMPENSVTEISEQIPVEEIKQEGQDFNWLLRQLRQDAKEMDQKMEARDQKMDQKMEARDQKMNQKMEERDQKMEEMNHKMTQRFETLNRDIRQEMADRDKRLEEMCQGLQELSTSCQQKSEEIRGEVKEMLHKNQEENRKEFVVIKEEVKALVEKVECQEKNVIDEVYEVGVELGNKFQGYKETQKEMRNEIHEIRENLMEKNQMTAKEENVTAYTQELKDVAEMKEEREKESNFASDYQDKRPNRHEIVQIIGQSEDDNKNNFRESEAKVDQQSTIVKENEFLSEHKFQMDDENSTFYRHEGQVGLEKDESQETQNQSKEWGKALTVEKNVELHNEIPYEGSEFALSLAMHPKQSPVRLKNKNESYEWITNDDEDGWTTDDDDDDLLGCCFNPGVELLLKQPPDPI